MNKEKITKEDILNVTGSVFDTMLDYVDNSNKELEELQQENKQLRKDYAKIVQNNCYTLELEKRIDKAIEYIESYKTDYSPYELSDYNVRKILYILKGDSNE